MRMQASELQTASSDAVAAFGHLAHHHNPHHHNHHHNHHHHAQHSMHLLPPPVGIGASAGGFSLASWGHHMDDDSKRPHYESHLEQHYDDEEDDDSYGDHDDDHDGGVDNDEYDHAASVLALPLGASAASTAVASALALSSGAAGGAPVSTKAARKTKREIFICPEVHCGKQFPRCGKKFNTSTKLKRHMRIHFPDGQNLFQCTEPTCSWACDNYKEYVTHQRLHDGVAMAAGGGAGLAEGGRAAGAGLPARKAAKSKAAAAKASPDASTLLHLQPGAQAVAPGSGHFYHPHAHIQTRRPAEFLLSHQQQQLVHPPSPESAHYGSREYDDRRSFGHTFDLREHHPQQPRDGGHHSSSNSSSSLHERDLDLEHEYDSGELTHHQHQQSHLALRRPVKQEERPRLPFPTQSFPSESSFSHQQQQQQPAVHRPQYYDYAAGGYAGGGGAYASSSYVRGPHDGGYTSGHQQLQHQDSSGRNSSSGSNHPHPHPQQHHHQYDEQNYGRHSEDSGYESPESARAAQATEDAKYAYAAAGIAPTPEFTGEELSAVLELMKDS
ncbi:hypothetical protein PybrP1_006493 [[Pythium] brassicae (nom. inval.)]|nr:hypothetical protein PybrP1_006493 [[Pythium] brassicae (nom. inval.)]